MSTSFSGGVIGAAAASVFALFSTAALAADAAAPLGVVSLSSNATAEVAHDLIYLTLSTTREGADAGKVQAELSQALDAALAVARPLAKPGRIDLRIGSFSLFPRYGDKKSERNAGEGTITGWRGSVELAIEGRDIAAIGQLAGRISTLTISNVGYGTSPALREQTEATLSTDAIARFRARAADYAKQFGYGGYEIREVTVGAGDAQSMPRPFMRTFQQASPPVPPGLPADAGTGTVTVSVSGTVQLAK